MIPVLVAIYLLVRTRLWVRMVLGVACVAAVVHLLARIADRPRRGHHGPDDRAAAGGGRGRPAPGVSHGVSMGALIGADRLNLSRIADLGAPVVSIGGAGTFDGVFLTGIIAGLLV